MQFTDRYHPIKKLGEGGMGEVWLVYDKKLAATFALKQLKPDLYRHKDWLRFEREIRHLRSIRHPNVVRLVDWSEEAANPFYTMEYCHQGSLETLQSGSPPDVDHETVKQILKSILTGLDHLHCLASPLIHRDLKPQNVLRGDDGQLKIADFGLSIGAGDETLTSTNWGSVGFTAPEQFTGMHSVDQRADLYSAGAIGFYLLTGEAPNSGEYVHTALGNDALAQVIARLVRPYPDDRPRAAGHALKALDVKFGHEGNSTGQYGTETELVQCTRCGSCAVRTHSYEPSGSRDEVKCLACGYQPDPIVEER